MVRPPVAGVPIMMTIMDVREFALRINAMMVCRHLLVDQTLKQ